MQNSGGARGGWLPHNVIPPLLCGCAMEIHCKRSRILGIPERQLKLLHQSGVPHEVFKIKSTWNLVKIAIMLL